MKKFISVLLCLIMIMGILPVTTFAAEVISVVNISNIDAPLAGQKPDYTATFGDGYIFTSEFDEDNEGTYNGFVWCDVTSYRVMEPDDVFKAGRTYGLGVVIKAKSGYSFRTNKGEPSVSGYINGKNAQISSVPDVDARSYIMVVYTFPVCESNEISTVNITEVNKPVAGSTPDYTVAYGKGYKANSDFDDVDTVTGISWFDVSEGDDEMLPTDVFEAGHVYRVAVVIKASDGYTLKKVDNNTSSVISQINGTTASKYVISGRNAGEVLGITYTFPACDYNRISAVEIDIDVPAPGEALDFTPTVADSSLKINDGSVSWKDITTGAYAKSGDKAIPGHKYLLDLWVNPKDNTTTRFAVDAYEENDITARIGGYAAEVAGGASNGATAGLSITFTVPDYTASVAVSGINAPVFGSVPDYNPNATLASYKITDLSWIDATSDDYHDWKYDISEFKAGHKYRVKITLETNGANRFSNIAGVVNATATINGKAAGVHYSDDPTELAIYYDFGLLPDVVIESVSVNGIDAPVVGETPDKTATCGVGYNVTDVVWVDSTGDYKDWVYNVEKFEAGHKYTVQVTLVTKVGYKLNMDGGYTDVTGKINNATATVYGSHSDTEVAIGYDFGVPADAIIENVSVSGIDAPVIGATPDKTANCGEGCTISEIVWVDSTGEYKDWVYNVEKFEADHKYTVQVTLVTKDGYKLNMDAGYTDVTGEINSETSTVYGSHSDSEVTIGYEFTKLEKASTVIEKVAVNGIDAPVHGKAPDKDATCGDGYTISEIVWVDSTGEYKDWVYNVEKFEAGHKYTVQVTLVTKDGYKLNMDDGYTDVTGEINGATATVYGSHSDSEVTIGYQFPAVAEDEHKHEYKKTVTVPTCTEEGYTTYTCVCGDSYQADKVKAKGHTPVVVPGKPATTTETGLTDGEKCSVCGKELKKQEVIDKISEDHKHTPGEWVVVKKAEIGVEGKEQKKCTGCDEVLEERAIPALTNPDADILLGDVNKDGKITAADARLALRIAATLHVPDEYQKKAANYNKDSKITAADARLILRKAANLD